MLVTRVMRAAAALSFAFACACGSSSARGGKAALTFRSRTYGYSIEHPADWSTIQATSELGAGQPPLTGPPITDVLANRADRAVSRMDLPALVVGAQRVAEGTSIEDWTTTVIDIASGQKDCGAPERTESVDVGGEEAALLSYPDCPKGSGLNHLWIAVVHRDRGFHIVYFDTAGHEAADRALLDNMLSSVSFG
jgi:hypothetical protein